MKRDAMAPHLPVAALAPSQRLAASHDALARYLRGGAAPESRTEGVAASAAAGGPAGSPSVAHPVHANLAFAMADKALAPLARDHPWALVGGAAAAGALIVAGPWRTLLRPLMVAGVVSPVLTRWAARALVHHLSRRLLGPDPGRPR